MAGASIRSRGLEQAREQSDVKRSVAIILFGQLWSQAIAILTGIMVARMLGPSDYGVSGVLRSLFTTAMMFAPLGLELAFLKHIGRARNLTEIYSVPFNELRILVAIWTGLLAIAAHLWAPDLEADVYHFQDMAWLLTLTAISLPFAADLAILGALYQSRDRAGMYAILTLYLQPIVRLMLLIWAWLYHPTLEFVVIIGTVQIIISHAVTLVHKYFWTRSERQQFAPPKSEHVIHRMRGILQDSVIMMLSVATYSILRSADILILGMFAPGKAVGEYAALSTVSQIIQTWPSASSQTLGPRISRAYADGNIKGVHRELADYVRYASIVGSFLFSGIAVFGRDLDLVFGPAFEFDPLATFLLPVGYLLSATLAPMGFALSMTGRHTAELGILIVGAALLGMSAVMLVPAYGQAGAAGAVLIAFAVVNLIRYIYVANTLKIIPGQWRDFFPPLAGLAVASICRWGMLNLPVRSFLILLAACIVYSLSYWSIILVLHFNASERHTAREIISRWSWR
jgi:stage V sporulation protein B